VWRIGNACSKTRADDAMLTLALSDSVTAVDMMAHWSVDDLITAAIAGTAGVVLWWLGCSTLLF
jgi:hypothetical protein